MSNSKIRQHLGLVGGINPGTTTGSGSAYVLPLPYANRVLQEWTPITVTIHTTNNVNATFDVEGSGAIPLYDASASPLSPLTLTTGGTYIFVYTTQLPGVLQARQLISATDKGTYYSATVMTAASVDMGADIGAFVPAGERGKKDIRIDVDLTANDVLLTNIINKEARVYDGMRIHFVVAVGSTTFKLIVSQYPGNVEYLSQGDVACLVWSTSGNRWALHSVLQTTSVNQGVEAVGSQVIADIDLSGLTGATLYNKAKYLFFVDTSINNQNITLDITAGTLPAIFEEGMEIEIMMVNATGVYNFYVTTPYGTLSFINNQDVFKMTVVNSTMVRQG